jgi:hypothetical protein
MFVVNLDDRRIYRFEMPSGALLGSFAHGAVAEPWAADARPFALAYHEGSLYHGLVRSAESTGRRFELTAVVYRSHPDGSAMEKVAEVPLGYARGRFSQQLFGPHTLEWLPWDDRRRLPRTDQRYIIAPMPLLTDIAFDGSGSMSLGLRDRSQDALALYETGIAIGIPKDLQLGLGAGDILWGTADSSSWRFDTSREHFDDQVNWFGAETALGGLAELRGPDVVLAGAYAIAPRRDNWSLSAGAIWFDAASGNKSSTERVCDPAGLRPYVPADLPLRSAHAHDGEPTPAPPPPPEPSRYEFRGPATVGDVEALCALEVPPTSTATPPPTATPTSTRTPTATPTVTVTRTRTPTATVTASATATREPVPIYLPILLREDPCAPGFQHTDVVLVLDASTSMHEPTRSGRSKLDAAREAAVLFVAQLDLAGGDRVAIASFNATARLEIGLTADRPAVEAALARIATAQLTRIQLGVAEGHRELTGPRHTAGNSRALVVLTDGRNNPEPVAQAVAAATAAKADGVRLFTIGLGEEVERDALAEMASRPEDFFHAPDGEDLLAIYEEIAFAIPCPPGSHWPGASVGPAAKARGAAPRPRSAP